MIIICLDVRLPAFKIPHVGERLVSPVNPSPCTTHPGSRVRISGLSFVDLVVPLSTYNGPTCVPRVGMASSRIEVQCAHVQVAPGGEIFAPLALSRCQPSNTLQVAAVVVAAAWQQTSH